VLLISASMMWASFTGNSWSSPEPEDEGAPEETHRGPHVEDPLCMSLGAQIDLLELQMNAIAQQNAELEQHLLPVDATRKGDPGSLPPEGPILAEEDPPEDDRVLKNASLGAPAGDRCVQIDSQELREQLAWSKQSLSRQGSNFGMDDGARASQFTLSTPSLQSLSEQICSEVAAAEQEVRRNAMQEVQEAQRRERQRQAECWELRLQLACAREQLQSQELQLQSVAKAADSPPHAQERGTSCDKVHKLHSELEAARQEAAQWRRMVLEEQERNNELQERLVEATRSERSAKRSERLLARRSSSLVGIGGRD